MIKHIKHVLLILIFNTAAAQTGNQIDAIFPSSPEASAMAEYAKIPVDLYTGLASINLPLMELKGRSVGLLVTVSYHSAGNKVNEISSSVGLGWTLNAGGVITRMVRGKPDDHEDGYVGDNQRGLDVDYDFNQLKPYFNTFSSNTWDAQPDIYFFNFMGKSGRFVLNASGEVVMTPEQDFKILPDFSLSNTIDSWTIIDKNGVEYKFGETAAEREESETISTFGLSGSNTEQYVSSWYLSTVTALDGDEFSFDYVQGNDITLENDLELYTTSAQFGNGYGNVSIVTDVFAPKTLSKITSRYGHIDITSVADRLDLSNSRRITQLTLYDHNNTFVKYVNFNQSYFYSKENCTDPECKRLKLESIEEEFKYTKSILRYEFEYNTTKLPRRDSPEIDHWGYYNANGLADLISRTSPYNIDSYRAPNENAAKANVLERIIYATGGYTEFTFGLNEWNDGSSNLNSGGLRIESIEDNDSQGGSIITNYSYVHENTTTSSGQQFAIPEYVNNWISIQSSIDQYGYSYPTYDSGDRIQSSSLNELFDVNGAPISYGEVIVGYADGSTEINKYSDLNSNGNSYNSSDYFRTNSDQTAGTVTTIVEYTPALGKPYAPPTTNNAYQRGFLKEKVVKDPLGNKTYQLNNVYEINSSNYKSAPGYAFDHIYLYKEYAPDAFGNPQHIANHFQYYVGKYIETNKSYRLLQSTEKTFDGSNQLVSMVDYTYTTSKPTLIKTQTTTYSNGDLGKTEYVYPFELPGATNTVFTQDNKIADYIEKYEYINSQQVGLEERLFGYNTTGYINNGNTPLPKQTNFKKKDLSAYTNLVVDRYDTYGNILQYHGNDDVPVSIIWGYGNRYPIAKIVNATYDAATDSAIGLSTTVLNSNSPSASSLRTEINKIRNHNSMYDARVTGYTHKPLVGVTGITDTRGYLTTYEYDDFNRLQFVKDQDGKLISENQYQYLTQNDGNGSSSTQLLVSVTYGASSDTYQDFIASPSGGNGIYDFKWYKGIGTSYTNFESTYSGTSSTFRLNVSCSTYQYVKLVTTSGGLTSTRIIRSDNSPCSGSGGGGGGQQNQP